MKGAVEVLYSHVCFEFVVPIFQTLGSCHRMPSYDFGGLNFSLCCDCLLCLLMRILLSSSRSLFLCGCLLSRQGLQGHAFVVVRVASTLERPCVLGSLLKGPGVESQHACTHVK